MGRTDGAGVGGSLVRNLLFLGSVLLLVGCSDHLFEYQSNQDGGFSEEGQDGGSDAGLPPTALMPAFARWPINEAASGQDVSQILDVADRPVNLALSFSGTSPRFAEDQGRYLEFVGTEADSGGALAVASNTKLDELHGSSTFTFEAKYSIETCDDEDPRIFELSEGTDVANATLSLRENNGSMLFALRQQGEGLWTRANHPCLSGGARVVHWVVDTTRLDQTSRIRYFVDGLPITYTLGGPAVATNAVVDLGLGERRVAIGKPIDGARQSTARIWYVALYTTALSSEEIQRHVNVLMENDD